MSETSNEQEKRSPDSGDSRQAGVEGNRPQAKNAPGGGAEGRAEGRVEGKPSRPVLSEKQRAELWMYIAVSIVAVDLLVAVGAVIYGFMSTGVVAGQRVFAFPWLSWGAVSVVAPALILLLVHFADVGLFRPPTAGQESEQEWQQHLPQRLQRLYRIVKGAPAAVILLSIVALGAALMTIDGALGLVVDFASALKPHIPYIAGALAAMLTVIALAVIWLNYRTRRLVAEYQFRREVLEKTGVIIVDKGSTALPPGGIGDVPYVLVSGEEDGFAPKALPSGQAEKSDESGVERGKETVAEDADAYSDGRQPGEPDSKDNGDRFAEGSVSDPDARPH